MCAVRVGEPGVALVCFMRRDVGFAVYCATTLRAVHDYPRRKAWAEPTRPETRGAAGRTYPDFCSGPGRRPEMIRTCATLPEPWSTADDRLNFTIVVDANVTRLVFHGTRCCGADYTVVDRACRAYMRATARDIFSLCPDVPHGKGRLPETRISDRAVTKPVRNTEAKW